MPNLYPPHDPSLTTECPTSSLLPLTRRRWMSSRRCRRRSSGWLLSGLGTPSENSSYRGKTPKVTMHLNSTQQFPTTQQTKSNTAGSLARIHLAPPFPAPRAVFAPSPTSIPSPSTVGQEGQIEIKVSPGLDPSVVYSPGTTDVTAMLNATCDAASPARSAPTPAPPTELEAPITPDP